MMDPSLQKEQELFKRKAAASSLIQSTTASASEKRFKSGVQQQQQQPQQPKAFASTGSTKPKQQLARQKVHSDLSGDYHSSSSMGTRPPTARFRQLTRIVEFMKNRHLTDQGSQPLTLEEISQECDGLTIDAPTKHWLASEALLSNPKIDVKQIENVNKFSYKPPLELKGKKKSALLKLLRKQHDKCEGAITVEDVRESIPQADKIIKELKQNSEISVLSGTDKKEILFINDRDYDLKVNPEFIESWRSISVDGLDEEKIREFLEEQGSMAMKGATNRVQIQKRKPARRQRVVKKHNDHVADQLEDYTTTDVNRQS